MAFRSCSRPGSLLNAWRLLWQAQTALTALDGGVGDDDRAFCCGKTAAGQLFANNMLPPPQAPPPEDVDLSVTTCAKSVRIPVLQSSGV